jgi:hypothetical protein
MADADHFLGPDPEKTHDSVAESNIREPHYLDDVTNISFFAKIRCLLFYQICCSIRYIILRTARTILQFSPLINYF